MPRYTYIQNSFSSGELSEKLHSRTDIKEYKSGLRTLKNMVPYKAGGARVRTGFRFAGQYKDGVVARSTTFSIPFIFSKNEIYDVQYVAGDIIVTDVNEVELVVANPTAFTDAINTGTVSSDPLGWSYAQTGDLLVLVHRSGLVNPIVISRTTDLSGNFVFTCNSFITPTLNPPALLSIPDYIKIPFSDPNTDSTNNLQISSATKGAIATLTASSARFLPSDIGSYFLLDNGATSTPPTLICRITAVGGGGGSLQATATVFIEEVQGAYPISTNTNFWYQSAWGGRRGYPRTVVVFENRLMFGGDPAFPDTIWASEQYYFAQLGRQLIFNKTTTYDYKRTSGGTNEPFEFTVSSNTVDNISWVTASRNLQFGTLSKEYVVTSGADASINRLNVSITPQSFHGSSAVAPVSSDFRTYFVSRDGKSIIEFGYSAENGSYITRNISTLADDIIYKEINDRSSRFTKLQWQPSIGTLWCLTSNNRLYGCTIDLTSGVVAWHRHTLEGVTVYDIVTRPSNNGDDDHLYAWVSHEDSVNNTLIIRVKAVEPFEASTLFSASTREEDIPVYLDLGGKLTLGAPDVTFPTQQNYADGLTVMVLADDGTIYENIVCTGGDIVLPSPHTSIIWGIPYIGTIELLTPEVGPNELLSSTGDILRIDRATIGLYKTWSGRYGSNGTLFDFEIPNTAEFTGKIKVDIPASPDIDTHIKIESKAPFPLAITGITLRGTNNA